MEQFITKISTDEYYSRYSNYQEVSELLSREDIATFIDIFTESGLKAYNKVKVLEVNKKYIFVYSDTSSDYDFFEELNNLSKVDMRITAQNVKLLFPKSISRGYLSSEDVNTATENISTSDMMSNADEIPTGIIGEDDVEELSNLSKQSERRVLLHINTNNRLPINDAHGVTIGRSLSQSEYAVSNTRVSRKHAKVYKQGIRYMVQDFGSANGTFVDGLKVSPDCDREILVGSILKLGDELFKLI